MKAFLPLLLSFFFIISCQQHKEATISPIDEEDELQEEADSLPRATAIFWLDKYHMKELKKDDVLTFRTAKAKVIIRNDGTTAASTTRIPATIIHSPTEKGNNPVILP